MLENANQAATMSSILAARDLLWSFWWSFHLEIIRYNYAVMQLLHSHYSSCCAAISTLSCSIILMSFDSSASYFLDELFRCFCNHCAPKGKYKVWENTFVLFASAEIWPLTSFHKVVELKVLMKWIMILLSPLLIFFNEFGGLFPSLAEFSDVF